MSISFVKSPLSLKNFEGIYIGLSVQYTSSYCKPMCSPVWWNYLYVLYLLLLISICITLFMLLVIRMCSVDVKSYRDGARHEMQLPLEGERVSTGQIRFAITVEMNSSGPQVFEEPQNIGVGSQVESIHLLAHNSIHT